MNNFKSSFKGKFFKIATACKNSIWIYWRSFTLVGHILLSSVSISSGGSWTIKMEYEMLFAGCYNNKSLSSVYNRSLWPFSRLHARVRVWVCMVACWYYIADIVNLLDGPDMVYFFKTHKSPNSKFELVDEQLLVLLLYWLLKMDIGFYNPSWLLDRSPGYSTSTTRLLVMFISILLFMYWLLISQNIK